MDERNLTKREEDELRILSQLRARSEVTGERELYVPSKLMRQVYSELVGARLRPDIRVNRRQADSPLLLHRLRWRGLTLKSTSEGPFLL